MHKEPSTQGNGDPEANTITDTLLKELGLAAAVVIKTHGIDAANPELEAVVQALLQRREIVRRIWLRAQAAYRQNPAVSGIAEIIEATEAVLNFSHPQRPFAVEIYTALVTGESMRAIVPEAWEAMYGPDRNSAED